MSTHLYLDTRFDRITVTCDCVDPIVRIVSGNESAALRLDNLADIERMETALAAARMNLAAQEARKEAA
jgi:hypothetical protein